MGRGLKDAPAEAIAVASASSRRPELLGTCVCYSTMTRNFMFG